MCALLQQGSSDSPMADMIFSCSGAWSTSGHVSVRFQCMGCSCCQRSSGDVLLCFIALDQFSLSRFAIAREVMGSGLMVGGSTLFLNIWRSSIPRSSPPFTSNLELSNWLCSGRSYSVTSACLNSAQRRQRVGSNEVKKQTSGSMSLSKHPCASMPRCVRS